MAEMAWPCGGMSAPSLFPEVIPEEVQVVSKLYTLILCLGK